MSLHEWELGIVSSERIEIASFEGFPAGSRVNVRHEERVEWKIGIIQSDTLTEVLDGALSKLLWLDMDGVRVRRGGNDLLWCCKCKCNGLGVDSSEPVLTAP